MTSIYTKVKSNITTFLSRTLYRIVRFFSPADSIILTLSMPFYGRHERVGSEETVTSLSWKFYVFGAGNYSYTVAKNWPPKIRTVTEKSTIFDEKTDNSKISFASKMFWQIDFHSIVEVYVRGVWSTFQTRWKGRIPYNTFVFRIFIINHNW